MPFKFLKDYLTFTRSERNGILILLVIIFVLVLIRLSLPYLMKNSSDVNDDFQEEIEHFEKSLQPVPEKNPVSAEEAVSELFIFDPNTADKAELKALGLPARVIRNLMKYRDNGGRFYDKEDLKKIYGLDSAIYNRLESYIIIESEENKEYLNAGEEFIETTRVHCPLNSSDSSSLLKINGIGPVLSVRIIKYRELLGGFVNKEQLLEVYGMTQEIYELVSLQVFIDSAGIRKINLNTADENTMTRHPYINNYQARGIVTYRRLHGEFKDAGELLSNNLLSEKEYIRLKPYLETK